MFVNNDAKGCDLISDCYWRGGYVLLGIVGNDSRRWSVPSSIALNLLMLRHRPLKRNQASRSAVQCSNRTRAMGKVALLNASNNWVSSAYCCTATLCADTIWCVGKQKKRMGTSTKLSLRNATVTWEFTGRGLAYFNDESGQIDTKKVKTEHVQISQS